MRRGGDLRVQMIVRAVNLAGTVMEELGNATGPRTEGVAGHCREFMLAMKVHLNLLALRSEMLTFDLACLDVW